MNRMMYGFRDASNGWARDWQALLREHGYVVGIANAALFYNMEAKSRGAVHGDDFYVLGPRRAIDQMGEVLKSKYSLRESGRLGFGHGCDRTATILNRVVTLSVDSGGRKVVTIVQMPATYRLFFNLWVFQVRVLSRWRHRVSKRATLRRNVRWESLPYAKARPRYSAVV